MTKAPFSYSVIHSNSTYLLKTYSVPITAQCLSHLSRKNGKREKNTFSRPWHHQWQHINTYPLCFMSRITVITGQDSTYSTSQVPVHFQDTGTWGVPSYKWGLLPDSSSRLLTKGEREEGKKKLISVEVIFHFHLMLCFFSFKFPTCKLLSQIKSWLPSICSDKQLQGRDGFVVILPANHTLCLSPRFTQFEQDQHSLLIPDFSFSANILAHG